jgi:hypothetical protein
MVAIGKLSRYCRLGNTISHSVRLSVPHLASKKLGIASILHLEGSDANAKPRGQ